jgi:hypothetical protein
MMTQIVARNHFDVTPNDSTVIYADALYAGVAGTIRCKDRDGTTANYTVVAGGQVPTNVTVVMATGTTATGIVGLLL